MLSKKSQICNLGKENIGCREICGRPDGAQKCPKPHFLRCKSVHFAFRASSPNDCVVEMHTFCFSKVWILHFCVPSRRLGFSRTPMFSCLILQFCDFGKVESSRSRARTSRVRVRAGMRNRAHASAKLMLFEKSQNCNLRQEKYFLI